MQNRLAQILISLLAFRNLANSYRTDVHSPSTPAADEVTVAVDRLRPAREFLLSRAIEADYLGCSSVAVSTDVLCMKRYSLARYALSPLVLSTEAGHEYLIVDASDPRPAFRPTRLTTFEVIESFQNGISILRRR